MPFGRRAWLIGIAGATLLATACRPPPPTARALPRGAVVLALGDSLTFGTGAGSEASYPAVLARLTGWQVINAGVPGHTSADALARAAGLLREHAPQLMLLSIGGNDFLRRLPETDTRAHIKAIAAQALAAQVQVLLVAVPRPSLMAATLGSLTDHPMYTELAAELGVPLQRQGWSQVLSDENLRADAIHANGSGYEQFARSLTATARAVGLLATPSP